MRTRPLARREASTARPARVRIRTRKPLTFARRRLFGWKVLFPFAISFLAFALAPCCGPVLESWAPSAGPHGPCTEGWRHRAAWETATNGQTSFDKPSMNIGTTIPAHVPDGKFPGARRPGSPEENPTAQKKGPLSRTAPRTAGGLPICLLLCFEAFFPSEPEPPAADDRKASCTVTNTIQNAIAVLASHLLSEERGPP